jgi:hypothetical protein
MFLAYHGIFVPRNDNIDDKASHQIGQSSRLSRLSIGKPCSNEELYQIRHCSTAIDTYAFPF